MIHLSQGLTIQWIHFQDRLWSYAMGKRCCCGSGSACCGCCCSKRGATVCFSLVGLALAVAVIVPPVYIYAATEDRNFHLLFPALELSKDALEHVRIPSRKVGAGSTSSLT